MDETLKRRWDKAILLFGEEWIKNSLIREFIHIMSVLYDKPEYIDKVINGMERREQVITFEMCKVLQDRLFVEIQNS